MRWLIRGWVALRRALETTVLAVLFFGLLTPVALVARRVRADPLQRGFSDRSSYWQDRQEPAESSLFRRLWDEGKGWMIPVIVILLAVGAMVALTEGAAALTFLYPLF